MLIDDGDIIRGLGFVTLYSAYLEEQIDDLLLKLNPFEMLCEDRQRWSITRKIKHAKNVLSKLDNDKFDNLIKNLDSCLALFNRRNELVHGRIYGGGIDRPNTMKSGRANTPDREVNSSELYLLATELWKMSFLEINRWIPETSKAVNAYLRGKI
jgi:hypothetical protein